MKKMILSTGLALGAMTSPVKAQLQTDTLATAVKDSFHLEIKPSPAPAFRTTATGLVVPAVMIGYGVAALRWHPLSDLNHTTNKEIQEDNTGFHTTIDSYLQYAPAVAVYALNLAGVKGKHNFRDRTIILGISAVLTAGSVELVKHVSHETRPDGSDNYSFPSGHTATAFASAEFLRQEYKDVSPWYGVAGYAAAAATGALRMYNNKHWFSDVVAGAGFGILSTKAAYWIYPWVQHKLFKETNKHASTMVLPYYNAQWHSAGLSVAFFCR